MLYLNNFIPRFLTRERLNGILDLLYRARSIQESLKEKEEQARINALLEHEKALFTSAYPVDDIEEEEEGLEEDLEDEGSNV